MAVYDASGRKIADSEPGSGPDPHILSMNVSTDQLGQTSGVYVKIATPPELLGSSSSSPGTGSDSFVLQVTREPEAGWPLSSLAQFLTPPVHLGGGASSLVTGIPQSAFGSGWESLSHGARRLRCSGGGGPGGGTGRFLRLAWPAATLVTCGGHRTAP